MKGSFLDREVVGNEFPLQSFDTQTVLNSIVVSGVERAVCGADSAAGMSTDPLPKLEYSLTLFQTHHSNSFQTYEASEVQEQLSLTARWLVMSVSG